MDIQLLDITVNSSTRCTMACKYCSSVNNPPKRSNRRDLELEQLELGVNTLRECFSRIEETKIHFNSQDVFLNFKTLMRPFIENHPEYSFSAHSNGLLLPDDTLSFLQQRQVTLMISLDGPPHVQNVNRRTKNNRDTFDIVWRNILRAKEYGIRVIIVSTFNADTIQYLSDSFNFHIENDNKFKFLFDYTYSDYFDKYLLVQDQISKVATDFVNLPPSKRALFRDISRALNPEAIKISTSINTNSINIKRHRHNYQPILYFQNGEYIKSEPVLPITEDLLLYTPLCPCNKVECLKCPAFHGALLIKEGNMSIYCRLFTAIFNELKRSEEIL